jgi:hypothetical protein
MTTLFQDYTRIFGKKKFELLAKMWQLLRSDSTSTTGRRKGKKLCVLVEEGGREEGGRGGGYANLTRCTII